MSECEKEKTFLSLSALSLQISCRLRRGQPLYAPDATGEPPVGRCLAPAPGLAGAGLLGPPFAGPAWAWQGLVDLRVYSTSFICWAPGPRRFGHRKYDEAGTTGRLQHRLAAMQPQWVPPKLAAPPLAPPRVPRRVPPKHPSLQPRRVHAKRPRDGATTQGTTETKNLCGHP